MIKRVLMNYSNIKWRMVLIVAVGIVGVVMYSMMPTYLNSALDKLGETAPNADAAYILRMLGIFLGLALINEVFSIVSIFIILKYEAKATQNVTGLVKRKLDVVPISYLERYSTGDLTRTVCYNVADMMKSTLLIIFQISRAVFFFITSSIAMFGINSILAIVVISSLPLSILAARFVSKRTQKYFKFQNESNAKLSSYLDQKASYHGFYKMHGLDSDSTEFNTRNAAHAKGVVGESTSTALNTIYITFIRNFMYVLITVLCCVLYLNGEISIVILPAFLLFGQRFLDNTVVVTTTTNITQIIGSRAERIFSILDSAEDVTEREHIKINKISGDIKFNDVTLSDDDSVILDNISLTIPEGASVAIVGPTGVDKHRLVELIAKLELPTKGTVTVGGLNLAEINSINFYSRMGIASEKPFLFRGTVAENLLYGVGRILPEHVMKITKLLGSHEFIEQLPRGYETEINDNTSLLSISEKQAINVARIVLHAGNLIILDSALTMADNAYEKQVFDEIIKLNKHQTKIFVTDRLDSVKNCDMIVFIENGKITEKGTHDELISLKGKYYKGFVGV